jgi:ribosome-associated toxin RatA of RatAB toxin-antitoxin module
MNRKVNKHQLPLNMSLTANGMRGGVAALLTLFATVLAIAVGLGAPSTCRSADWALSEAEIGRVTAGAIVAEGEVATDRAVADVRAAIRIAATPEQVFLTLTDCSRALRFVPHLKRCAVLATGPEGRWQNVEQLVDYGWLVPRAHYVFHAEYEKFSRIHFSNLSGDFHENRGVWVFRPLEDGRATLVTYEARVAPAFYVPRWMMRNMLKRDLPELMRGLKGQAEAAQR